MARSQPWLLVGFAEGLDEWIDLEAPPEDLRVRVTGWVLTRIDDPFESARREAEFDDLWSAIVPGSIHARNRWSIAAFGSSTIFDASGATSSLR